jgi:hypothetical protein
LTFLRGRQVIPNSLELFLQIIDAGLCSLEFSPRFVTLLGTGFGFGSGRCEIGGQRFNLGPRRGREFAGNFEFRLRLGEFVFPRVEVVQEVIHAILKILRLLLLLRKLVRETILLGDSLGCFLLGPVELRLGRIECLRYLGQLVVAIRELAAHRITFTAHGMQHGLRVLELSLKGSNLFTKVLKLNRRGIV